jgi:predicted 3-demethylubiquinone-9 3-methyltransferase (glyoxalase superfamily)
LNYHCVSFDGQAKQSMYDYTSVFFEEKIAFIFGFKDQTSSAKTAYQFSKENEKLSYLVFCLK